MFEGDVMQIRVYSTIKFWSRLHCNLTEICFKRKLCVCHSSTVFNYSFSEDNVKIELWLLHFGDLHVTPEPLNFFNEHILCKKTSAITYSKMGPVTLIPDPTPGCVARGAGCTGPQNSYEQLNFRELVCFERYPSRSG